MRRASAPILQHLRRGSYIRMATAVAVVVFLATLAQSQAAPAGAIPSPPDFSKYPGLLPEFGRLFEKLQRDVQVPQARSQSRLLPLLPESTIFFVALPNYGDASHQALEIFQNEVKENSVLRQWWQQGEMAASGAKIDDGVNKFYLFSQFLGDEIVVSGSHEGSKEPNLLILAEVHKPGLKEFLQQTAKEIADKSGLPFRIVDVKELATAAENSDQHLKILVSPDFVAAALDLATLRSFNARLEKNSREFAETPFGQRVVHVYDGGANMVVAADLQKIISQLPTRNEQTEKILQRTGFADAKYLVWEHKSIAGQAASQVELSFTTPRHGVASWLAPPGPMGSLDFISPKAMMAGAVLLKNPADIFDDVEELAGASSPNAMDSLTQTEQVMKLNFKDDLFSRLGGEIAFEGHGMKTPDAAWKFILSVNDPDRLQMTFDKLLTTMHMSAQQSQEGGVTYHTLEMPRPPRSELQKGESPRNAMTYAFVDGYLVIASSREAVAEAIRLHHGGESLAKSERFLAAMPPGRGAEASAVFYELPNAVAAMSLRQVMPQMADSLAQAESNTTPAIVCAYGEETALREASRSGAADFGGMLIGAAIAIPNLMRARMAANDSSAVSTIRTANTAQVIYAATYPERGFARDLARLGPDPSGSNSPSPEHASVIDAALGDANCKGANWCTKSGFRFIIVPTCGKQRCDDYAVVGTPVDTNSGTRSFCSTSDGVVRFKVAASLTDPVSAAECRKWRPVQ